MPEPGEALQLLDLHGLTAAVCIGATTDMSPGANSGADSHLVYGTAAPPLASATLAEDPPSIVRRAQDTVAWLSSSIARLDEDSPDAPAALSDALARSLIAWVFSDAGRLQLE